MAGVLKPSQIATGQGFQPIAFNLQDVAEQAKGQLEQVRQQAAQLVEQAVQDAERIRRETAEQTRRDTLLDMEAKVQQRAAELAAKQTAEATQQLRNLVERLSQDTESWITAWRNETLGIASAMAEKIIRREVEKEPQIVIDWVQETIGLLRGARQVDVLLHPQTHARLAENVKKLLQVAIGSQGWSVIEDATVDQAGCVVRTDLGQFDWQLQTQLQRLVDQMR